MVVSSKRENIDKSLWKSLANSIQNPVILLDSQVRIVDFNNFSEVFFTYKKEEVIGQSIHDFLFSDKDQFIVEQSIIKLLNDSDLKLCNEFSIKTNSGLRKSVTWNYSTVRTAENLQYILLVGICSEIDKRNELLAYEEAIKESEEKYRKLVETAPDAIVLYDFQERKVLDINERACSLFKMPREELMQIKHRFLTPEYQPTGSHYREKSLKYIHEAIEGKDPVFEWTYLDGEGNLIPTKVWLTRLPAKNKILIRASIVDMSEVKKREKQINQFIRQQGELLEAIKIKEARLSALINNSTDLIFSVDREFRLLEFNKAYSSSSLKYYGKIIQKGDYLYEVIGRHHWNLSLKGLNRALEGESSNVTMDFTDLKGNIKYVNVLYSPIISGLNEISGVVVTVRDITENRIAENKLLEINGQMAEYKLMALRSVMNPHFLFNSLNSIQCFMAKNERKLALDYLSIFSNLIRRVLESSVNPKVKLSTEIEILKNYIDLEILRSDQNFDYTIDIDNDIDPDLVEIPSLLIQPYVENAILHGLMNQPKYGNLKISLRNEGEHMLIVVEDNGIGRKQSQEINEKNMLKDKSYGMSLTEQRLEIINKSLDVSVLVEDLYEESGEPSGTRIKIYIKF